MKTQPRLTRRSFLLGVTGGTAAAAAAVVADKQKDAAAAAAAVAAGDSARGYQVTEHIRNYYRTTRV